MRQFFILQKTYLLYRYDLAEKPMRKNINTGDHIFRIVNTVYMTVLGTVFRSFWIFFLLML